MYKIILSILLFIMTSAIAHAQYVQYEPNPTPPPPAPIELPQIPITPVPRYMLTQPTNNKPTYSILTKFLIQSARVDGQDVSQHYINANAGIAIYNVSNERVPFMAIVLPGDNSNTNGKMLAITTQETPQTDTSFGKTTVLFSWEFVNSTDGKSGTATVTLVKEYRPTGTFVNCHIQANTGTVCDFTGILGQ